MSRTHWTLVTGGAQRLGKDICRTLAKQGRNIVVHYKHSEQDATQLVSELRVLGVKAEALFGDFSSLAATQTFLNTYLSHFPQTDGVVNNVGNYLVGSLLNTAPEALVQLFQENVAAAFTLMQGLLPHLSERAVGRIVNIGMVGCAKLRANTHATAYHLTKQALYMLTCSLAKECAGLGVTVNMVSPGYLEGSVDLPKAEIPMGRLASPQEVARVVAFLMEPASSYITGQNIEVAGAVYL